MVESNKYWKKDENKMQICGQIVHFGFVWSGFLILQTSNNCHIKLKVVGWKPSIRYRVALTVYTHNVYIPTRKVNIAQLKHLIFKVNTLLFNTHRHIFMPNFLLSSVIFSSLNVIWMRSEKMFYFSYFQPLISNNFHFG